MRSARDIALEVLRRVATQGAFASAALRAELERDPGLSGRDRGLTTELVYGVLRRRAQLDKAIAGRGRRFKDLNPKVHDVLRLAAYQVLFLDRVPAHAAVSAAVDQARVRAGKRGAGQVNAILRKLTDKPPAERMPTPPALGKDPVAHIALAASVSRPIAQLLVDDFGPAEALAIATEALERAPLVLRANRLRTTREALATEVDGTAGHHPLAVHLPDRAGGLVSDLDAVLEGRASHQDEASMQIIDLLDPQPGESILDLCAAPGGKTCCIAETMGDEGQVVAHDRTPEKIARITANAERLGLASIETAAVLPEGPFDRVLVDAPCSGLGTLRRHPEIRWRFSADDLPALARTQAKLLKAGAALVRPGGVLVYSVCTVPRAEAELQVRDLEGFDVVEQVRTRFSAPGAPDAFFAARLVKR